MPLVQNVRTRTPETTAGTLPELVAIRTMPTAVIMIVGSSTASISTTCARRSCNVARGNRTRRLCHVGGPGHRGNCIVDISPDVLGNAAQLPDQAHRREGAEHVIRHVDLPPVEALARRGLVV